MKNKINCSSTLEILIVIFGESTLNKKIKIFLRGTSFSQKARKMLLTMPRAAARQKPMKTLKQ